MVGDPRVSKKKYEKKDLQGKLKEKTQAAIDYHNNPNVSNEYWALIGRDVTDSENRCPPKSNQGSY